MSTVWLVIRALLALLPLIVQLVRDNRIKGEGQEAVVKAIMEAHDERLARARDARNQPDDPDDDAHRRD